MNKINEYKNRYFNYSFYLSNYSDLKNAIINEQHAWFHVTNFGWKENRIILEDLNKNIELIDLLYNNEKEQQIDLNCGFVYDEIFNKLPKNFDYKTYLKLNDDLKNTNFYGEYGAIYHYINYGKHEKRKITIENKTFLKRDYFNFKNNIDISDKKITYKKNILIVYHLGSLNYNFTYNIINYLINYDSRYNFSLYITINEEFKNHNQIKNKIHCLKKNTKYFCVKYIKNIGADVYPFIDFISSIDTLEIPKNINFILKIHTKQSGYETFRLCSIFQDLNKVFNIFEKNDNIGIIGEKRFLMPIYMFLSNEYSLKMNFILKYLFNLNIKCYSDYEYLKILDNFCLSKDDFDNKKYYESKIDLFENKNFNLNNSYNHFQNHKNKCFNHYGYYLNNCNVEKIVTGTIFIMRFDILKNINNDYKDELIRYNSLIEKYENCKYYSNFDNNGNTFRYVNAGEYLIQSLIYKYDKFCYGYELNNYDDFINNSICLNSLHDDFIKYYNNSTYMIDEEKENILFITNELSKTGAPIILKKIILKLKYKYNIFVVSLYQGDDIDFYIDSDIFNYSIFKDYVRLGINIFKKNINFIKKCVIEKVKPSIVYCNTFVSNFGIYGSNIKNKPYVILHVHEPEEEIINLINNNHIISFDFLNYCDKIITVNNYINKFISSLYDFDNDKVITIYNDIEINKSNLSKKKSNYFICKKIKVNKNKYKFIIGGSGSLNYRKGFDIFYKCSLKYSNYLFIWTTNNGMDDLKRNLNISNIPNNLKIINLEKNEMSYFYYYIDYFLYTSRSEAFPLTFFEIININRNILLCKSTLPFSDDFFMKSNIKYISEFVSFDSFVNILNKLDNNFFINNDINMNYITKLTTNNIEKILEIINIKNKNPIINEKCNINETKNEIQLYNNLNIYNMFSKYALQKDLLNKKFTNNFHKNLNHYLNFGFKEGRNTYRLASTIKKTILFVFHELTFNGATRVGLEIACNLQNYYNVIVISQKNGNLINEYFFENPIIVINDRNFEYDLIKYIDRKELFEDILKIINPDLVYITSSVVHYAYHACCELNMKVIYHIHEGKYGYTSQLNSSQVPIDNFHNYFDYPNENSALYYSPSKLSTHVMINNMKINKNKIKEFQIINFSNIDTLKDKKENLLTDFLLNKQINIGMVGLSSYRKGFDTFYNLSINNPLFNFIWIGFSNINDSNISNEMIINKPNNLYLINETTNPYAYIKLFDYFLCTSREDIGPLTIIESLYLNIPTIYLKKTISLDNEFSLMGSHSIDKDYTIESFQYIIDNIHNFGINSNQELLKIYYSFNNKIENIKIDINTLVKNKINLKKYTFNKYYTYNNKIVIHDYNKIDLLLEKHHDKPIYNENIFMNKYNFLYKYFIKNNINIEDIYNKHISNRLTCIKDDWKLFIAINKEKILKNGIITKKRLDNNFYNDIKYEFDFIKYKKKYRDLEILNDNELENHFFNFGIFEGRSDF